MFKYAKITLLTLAAFLLLGFSITVNAEPPKGSESEAQPFQVVLSVHWENDGGLYTSSNPFTFGVNKTAELQYVACRMRHSYLGSANAQFQLVANIEGGLLPMVTIIAGDMVKLANFTPPSQSFSAFNELVSACVGKKCNSMGDGDYVSLTLSATRSSADTTFDEDMDCLISGVVY